MPHDFESPIAQSLKLLVRELHEAREQRKIEHDWFKSTIGLATKHDLEKLEKKIMSAISDYAAAVNTSFDEIDSAVEGVSKSITGIADDVTYLKEVIDKLQTTPGPITPED